MADDVELLRRYSRENSEAAFAEFVRRHVDFVYAAALRQAGGNAPLAQDVTQAVFTDLARKAPSLLQHEVIVGWLHTATRFAAAKTIRSESRRRVREHEFHAINDALRESAGPIEWERLQPVMDEVLGELKDRERAAIILRYFEKRSLAEVGAKLSLTETAARSCVDRALEKMRVRLGRRGVISTAAALSGALAAQVGVAAPAGLAMSVTGAAMAGAAASGTAVLLGISAFMSTTKLAVGVIFVAAVGTAIQQNGAKRTAEATVATVRREQTLLQAGLIEANKRADLAEKRAAEAERDSGELLRGIDVLRAGQAAKPVQKDAPISDAEADEREATRLGYERAFQQDLAIRRVAQAKVRAQLADELAGLDPLQRFTRLIEVATAHATHAEFQEGMRVWNDAMRARPADVPLTDEMRQLRAILVAQSEPVSVSLHSQNETYIMIAGFRAVGLGYNGLHISPGDYEVVGMRKGYQDARIPLRVRSGEPQPVMEVACTVPLQ